MEFYTGTGRTPEAEQSIASPVLTDEVFQAQTAPDKYRLVHDDLEADSARTGRGVVRAVNTALLLRLPLLVSGEPGSGKTQLGYAIAHELGKPAPFKFSTKSVSAAQDLFYTYDAVRHFQAAQALSASGETNTDVREYLNYAPLGLAILLALPYEQRRPFLPPSLTTDPAGAHEQMSPEQRMLLDPEPRQCVVIIDEIDKAPRDFPNDLLHEIENMRFRVPELGGLETPIITSALRPIVLITTNSERQLPDAFLRRCAYVHIEYPRGAALESILAARLSDMFAASAPFLKDVQAFYEDIRQRRIIDKPPGTAELLQFLQAMAAAGVDQNKPISAQQDLVMSGITLLGKIKTDQDRLIASMLEWGGRQP